MMSLSGKAHRKRHRSSEFPNLIREYTNHYNYSIHFLLQLLVTVAITYTDYNLLKNRTI